jgi:hypothetical protein
MLISSADAMTDEERAKEASRAVISIHTLMPNHFQNFNSEVDKNNTMNIYFNCLNKNLDMCLSGIIGAYHSACLLHSDMGNLDIYIGSKEDPSYLMHCEKSWANAIWKDLNSVDNNALANLILMLKSNAINFKSIYGHSYIGPTSGYAGAGKGSKRGSKSKNIGSLVDASDALPSTPLGIGF